MGKQLFIAFILTSLVLCTLLVFSMNFVSAIQVCQVYDDFESGNADKWMNQNGNWTIVNDNGNYVYRQSEFIGGGSHWRWAVADFYGGGYSVEVDMRYIEMGDFGMGFLMYSKDIVSDPSNDETLSIALYPRYNQISLYVKESGLSVKEYISSHSFEQNRWYNVRTEVQNGLINVFLDNQIAISNISTNILNEGYILLNTDDLKADFDNIRVISEITQPDLEERVSLLESWKQIIEDWKNSIIQEISDIWLAMTGLTTRVEALENKTETNLSKYANYMSFAERKTMLCGYAKANKLTSIQDLGLSCKLIYKRVVSCNCQVI